MELPPLDRSSPLTLPRQIFLWIKNAVVEGRLAPGECLPATRELSRLMGISRNSVCEAYELLAAEGYITSSVGTKSRILPGVTLSAELQRHPFSGDDNGASGESGMKGKSRMISLPRRSKLLYDFRTGKPDPDTIPRSSWRRAMAAALVNAPFTTWLYGPAEGDPKLREELAAYLFRSRGLRVPPEYLFISSGATHALHVAASVLAREAVTVAVEDPCHSGMARTLRNAGLRIEAIPIDERGMRTELLKDEDAAYVTPSHQFPLGGVLPADRRTRLVLWAREADRYIIEDDYDSEFRYSGPPIAPLWSLDPEHTIYVGTFSKTLFPALRVGYALVPQA